jgi:hypothetical protein
MDSIHGFERGLQAAEAGSGEFCILIIAGGLSWVDWRQSEGEQGLRLGMSEDFFHCQCYYPVHAVGVRKCGKLVHAAG